MNKNQNWRRVLSLLFAMVMLVSMMVVGSVVASAEEAEPVQDDHYVVSLKVDGVITSYTSFDEAWDAMNATGNTQVDFYILEDITLNKSYVLEKEKHINYLMSNPMSKFTLTGTTDEPLFVINKGQMTVKNINVVSKGDTFQVGGGKLSIQAVGGTTGGQYTNVTSLEGSVLNITGGSVDFTGGPVLTALGTQPAVKNDGKGTLSINQWSWNNESILQAPNAETVITWNGEGALNISYGFIDGEIAANDASKVNITGGKFTVDMNEYCDPAYCTVMDDAGQYVVAPKLVTVDGVAYADWDKALENMKGNSFIKLYDDINNPYASKFGSSSANQTRTLDLNGHNFTSNFFGISASATIHVMDSVGGGSMKVEYIVLYHNGYLSLDSNVNFTSVININYYSDAQPSTGAVYIDGVKVFGRGHFSLEDGIVGNVGAAKITLKNGLADITLTSGNFVLNEDVITPADQNLTIKTTLTVNEGVTLTIDPATNLTISGNGVIKGEGTIAVGSLTHLNLVFDKTAIKNVHFTNSFALDGVVLSDADMNYTGAANLLNSGVVITAGTFDADVKSLCPAGYCVPEENGVWTVLSAHDYEGVETAPTYEADGFTTYTCANCGDSYVVVDEGSMLVLATVEMNGVKYPTIYDALNVLQPRETATIKFLEDYTFTADQRMFSNYTIVINAEYVTLDLNGKNITFDYTGSTATCYASIAIYNKGTLTIVDSSEEKTGTLYSKTAIQGNDGPRILWITSAGTATIEGGNFISEQGDTMFYTSNSNAEIPTCLYIKGGYFEHTIPTSGTTYRYFNQQNGYQKQIIEISGGTFKHNPTDGEMKYEEGFGYAENSDGTFGVIPHVYDAGVYTAPTLEADGFTTYTCVDCGVTNVVTHEGTMLVPVAEVNGVKYESVQAAVDAAKDGDTVKVLLRHAVSDSIVIDKNITLDLSAAGARIDAAADLENKPVLRVLATVTIKGSGGIIDGYKGINSYAIIVGNSTTAGTLYISEGMFRGVTSAISVTNGTAYISGGTFYTKHDGEGTDYGATYMLNCLDSAYNNGTAKIIVTGGLFDGFNPYNNAAEGANTNFCPENYRTNLNSTWYSVTYAVAERNGIFYPSIREAASDNGTVTVLIDHEVDLNNNFYGCPIVANGKEIVIDLNGKTIVADWSKYTYNSGEMGLFVVANGGKLTITGNGTVINKDSGKVNIEAHIFYNMNGSAARHNYLIVESGTFYQYDSTQILYSQGHAASNNVLDQHTYIKGGTFISLCANETMKNDFFNAKDWNKQYTEITGGTFSMNPRDWELTIPEGYCVAQNSDGLYTVQKEEFTSVYTAPTFDADGFTDYTCKFCAREYTVVDENSKLVCVAEYKGVKYTSFWDALEASKTGDKSAVTVYQTVVITEDCTVDLGGVRVNAGKGLVNAPVFRVLAKVIFIGGIVDARGPVAGEGGVNAYAFIVGNSETAGTLTITAGTYRGVTTAISITNGTVNISGGTFQTGHDNEGTDYGTTYLLNCLDSAYKNGTAKFNITGGKFVGFNPENNAAEGAGTNFLSGNYKASDYYGDNKWYVAEANVVMDGDKYFATIKDALATLLSADTTVHTVKVLRDLEIDVNNSSYNYPILVNGFAIELDLNGKTLTADWSKYTGTRADNALIGVCNGGKLTIIDSVGGGKIVNNDDKPNVENRIFWIMTSTANKSIEVVIKGGTFVQNDKNTALLYIQGNKPSDNLAPIYVSIVGGHFETVNEDFFNAYDGYKYTATISGGTFNKNPTDSEIKPAEGFCVVPNADGTYGVETLKFKGARLLLKDGIGIYFMLNTEDLKRNDYVAVFTYVDENGETVKVEVEYKDWKHFEDRSNSGILFDGIVAKSIATEVSVVIMVDGKAVSETQKMSVKAYAQAIINGDKYTAEAKALAEALLNYGALAENSFASSENKSDMTDVNADVNSKFEKLNVKMDSSKVSNNVYYGSSVNLESYLGFNFKFRAEAVAGATKAVITYGTNNKVDASITLNEDGSLAIVTLNGLKVSDADLALTCTLYDENNKVIATATDSVYNYCARALKGLGNMSSEILAQQNFQPEFYKALVLYIEAANKYTEVIGYDAE